MRMPKPCEIAGCWLHRSRARQRESMAPSWSSLVVGKGSYPRRRSCCRRDAPLDTLTRHVTTQPAHDAYTWPGRFGPTRWRDGSTAAGVQRMKRRLIMAALASFIIGVAGCTTRHAHNNVIVERSALTDLSLENDTGQAVDGLRVQVPQNLELITIT